VARILFVVPPFYGHITATLGVGDELMKRGHQVSWVSLKDINAGYLPEGARWIVPDAIRARADEVDEILQRQNEGTKLSPTDALDFGLGVTLLPFANIMNDYMQQVIEEEKPDFIVHDESAFFGAIAAVKNNIPYATSITVPPGYFESKLFYPDRQELLLNKMREYQKELGITEDKIIFNSDKLVLSFTSRELLQPHYGDFEFEAPMAFVGASVTGRPEPASFDWTSLPEPNWPCIYVSIGTVLDDIRSSIFSKIIAAFKDSHFNIIANTDPALFEAWPDNFIVQKLCPQLEILERVDLVISHGGFNTVNEALYFNKPILAIPLAWDQSPNSDLLVKNGCGVKFRHRRLKPEVLRAAAENAMTDEVLLSNVQRISDSLRRLGGSVRAADLIEQAL
jgi:MGT family glycosyltransferase